MLDSITKGGRMRNPKDKPHKSDRDKTKSKASGGSHRDGGPPFSFLFVINELVVDHDHMEHMAANGNNNIDQWFNRVPPRGHGVYRGEIGSRVMRYEDGVVTAALGYNWFRHEDPLPGQPWHEGAVCAYDPNGMPLFDAEGLPYFATKYKSFTVFSCNPLLPIVVVEGDQTTVNGGHPYPLLFFHPRDMSGLSQAVTQDSVGMGVGPGLVKYAAGANPSWIPGLVPATYGNPYFNAPQSVGLAGELPIVLGLMAFSEAGDPVNRTNRTEEIFLGGNGHRGRWRDGIWHHSAAPKGYPLSMQEDPRAFLVEVFLDPLNPAGSTSERIYEMEWQGIIVGEASSSHKKS